MNRRFSHPFKSLRVLAAAGLVASLGACSGLSELGKTPEEIVALRSQARWDAIFANNWETAYSYATPAYRERVDLKAYRALHGSDVDRKGARVAKVNCESAEACVATVTISFTMPQLPKRTTPLETSFDERWLLGEDGRWYLLHRGQ
ncbi:hypothetical protein AGMMS49543_18450 [Betaproteobacteria bacterium]|nr:hypothetical protein AGMMS49543_18450 [Betaproteobacteria bacterium]GHU22193.1 hypothetical protein AGMMS50243_21310 [Betaproteobacteria bacterium]